MTTLALTDTSHVNTGGAAEILGCTRHRVLSFATRGLLTPVTMAGRVFFSRTEVEALRDQLAAERKRRRAPSRRVHP